MCKCTPFCERLDAWERGLGQYAHRSDSSGYAGRMGLEVLSELRRLREQADALADALDKALFFAGERTSKLAQTRLSTCDTVAALDALEAERDELRARVNADAPYSSMMAATDRWQRRAIALQARLDAATELIRQGWLSLHRYHAMTEEAWLTTLQTCEFCAPFRAWLEGEGR